MDNIGVAAYSKYKGYDEWPYKAITYLIENNEMIWKLIKYTDPDAWKKPNVSLDEKRAMIFKGFGEMTDFRVFMDIGQPDVFTDMVSIIKISNYELKPRSRTTGIMSLCMETYCHYKINQLSNYRPRIEMIAQQFMEVFNGADLGLGLGRLYCDMVGSPDNRLIVSGSIPYKGKYILFSNNIGG